MRMKTIKKKQTSSFQVHTITKCISTYVNKKRREEKREIERDASMKLKCPVSFLREAIQKRNIFFISFQFYYYYYINYYD
mmetsp:Transcript_24563/g.31969  ORF Transcript_24563/g.31969 Transcript_24563/m.31969 type:complete len:80 (+) Transcript_24563:53-292(+)